MAYDYSTTNRITVEISLEDEMRINRGSYITIVKGLLSGAELHIHLNKEVTDYFHTGEVMEGRTEEDVMAAIQSKLMPGIADLLPKLDSILTGLQTLVQHPALTQSLVHIERTSGHLETATRELNRLLDKDVPVIVSNLTATTANLNDVSAHLKDLDLASTMQAVNATLANLQETTGKLNATDNSLGLLLNDKSLYQNLNGASENASLLLFDLREHPKRYVHFSLF
jgi:phospholipid/cholesterol/gamma-HCH transport system substrate-binding protein